MPFAAIWMDLNIVLLNENSQRQISYDIIFMWNITQIKLQRKQTYVYQRRKGEVG